MHILAQWEQPVFKAADSRDINTKNFIFSNKNFCVCDRFRMGFALFCFDQQGEFKGVKLCGLELHKYDKLAQAEK